MLTGLGVAGNLYFFRRQIKVMEDDLSDLIKEMKDDLSDLRGQTKKVDDNMKSSRALMARRIEMERPNMSTAQKKSRTAPRRSEMLTRRRLLLFALLWFNKGVSYGESALCYLFLETRLRSRHLLFNTANIIPQNAHYFQRE